MVFKFVLFLLSTNVFKSYVSSLKAEDIIGGYIAYEGTLKYQVSIQWTGEIIGSYYSACGGAIIHEWFILSAAHCFVDGTGKMYQKIFSISAGSIDLQSPKSTRIFIDTIFLPAFEERFNIFDLAVAKLKLALPFYTRRFSKLALPVLNAEFSEILATVSGFGFDWVIVEYREDLKKEVRSKGTGIPLMKSASVRILDDKDCRRNYPTIDLQNQLCGVMVTESPEQIWGICQGDSGGPLVIDGVVVGIVSKNPTNCDDTIFGCLYTKVSHFVNFINEILDGVIRNTTIVLHNFSPTFYQLQRRVESEPTPKRRKLFHSQSL